MKKTQTTLNIKKFVDKLTKLIKSNEKFRSKITVLICMTTFEGYGSLKSCFMQEFRSFSRILAVLLGYKISPLENKKNVPKDKKTLKDASFIKIIKKM